MKLSCPCSSQRAMAGQFSVKLIVGPKKEALSNEHWKSNSDGSKEEREGMLSLPNLNIFNVCS